MRISGHPSVASPSRDQENNRPESTTQRASRLHSYSIDWVGSTTPTGKRVRNVSPNPESVKMVAGW